MNKKLIMAALLLAASTVTGFAQRAMEKLDRGLVAVKTTSGVYCSWRMLGNEFYDVQYNIYRDGQKINSAPLNVSNYTDATGTATSTYTVTAIVRGKEQAKSKAVTPWANDYLVIPKAKRISNDGKTDMTNYYEPNDATFGDIDGDGEMEVFVKEIETKDDYTSTSAVDFDRIEVYKLNGTLLWWIDCGPNLSDFQHNETNIAVYDWDQDGKAEAVMRAADGTTIHMADGTTYVIGDKSKNYRAGMYQFVNQGSEFLVYMNGATGKPYYVGDYPLKRLESGESGTEAAWGDGYGHRASKHFFGAPYLDGKHPSLFLARGIYTRHKMIAYDIDPATHKLLVHWTWNNNAGWRSPWYGQGYHNYTIADVDQDGRDEICFGSMVIDDNGQGLSSTGLGHGDAQHWGDFDPYKHGLEFYGCNETQPSNNYRDATTSKIYYRLAGGSDDGRAMCDNFTNDLPGAIGFSGHDSFISCVKADHVDVLNGANGVSQNFRTYWDGDMLSESFNGTATRNSNGTILKYGKGSIKTFDNTYTNNDTKATPCFQGDIFGDWREEIAMRDGDNNIRIEFSTIPTDARVYTLLHDPQYRNAMVWQMNGYNQPPHVSYFMGELEGITPPPAPIENGKQIVAAGGTIATSLNDSTVMTDEIGNTTYTVASGASPYILYDNVPSWVQGHQSNDNISYDYFTHTFTGAAFTGNTRIVKLGDGIMTLPKVTQTYANPTEVWAGTVNFDGEMKNSHVWLNRFAELNSDGGKFDKGIEMKYASVLRPGGKKKVGTVTVDSLDMGFGSRLVIDIDDNTKQADKLVAEYLKLEKKNWMYGPQYSAPVIEINPIYKSGESRLEAGKYEIVDVAKIDGNLTQVTIDGISNQKAELLSENGKIFIEIADQRDPSTTEWSGAESSKWDMATSSNFLTDDKKDIFVTGDSVIFNDKATNTNVAISGSVAPADILFNNETSDYALTGDSIIGKTNLTKTGKGSVTMNAENHFSGTVAIKGGTVNVSSLANNQGVSYGSLGVVGNRIELSNGATLGITDNVTDAQQILLAGSDGTLNIASGKTLTMNTGIISTSGRHRLNRKGSGTLTLAGGNSLSSIYTQGGTLNLADGTSADTIIFANNARVYDSNTMGSYSTNASKLVVDGNNTGYFYLDPRCNYTGTLTGTGTLHVYAAGNRNYFNGNWSNFEGTVIADQSKRSTYDPSFDWQSTSGLPKATLQVQSGTTFNAGSYSFRIGHVQGSGTIAGTGTLTIGELNKNISQNIQFSGVRVNKVGSGYWLLSSSISQPKIGYVTIQGGILRLSDTNEANGNLTGSSTVAVTDSGRIEGSGMLRSLVQNGGTVSPGLSYLHYGKLHVSGNATFNSGAVEMWIRNADNTATSGSKLEVDGTLAMMSDDTLKINLYNYTPQAGDSIVLWEAGKFQGTPKVILPQIDPSLSWDTTSLLQATGVLKVTVNTGIYGINADGNTKARIYTIDGKLVNSDRESLPSGVYIIKEGGKTYKIKK